MTFDDIRETPPPIDPVSAGFDRLVALAGYGLLFAGVFTFGLTAFGALALALVHRKDAQPIPAGHFRFQVRIFLVAFVLFLLCLASALFLGVSGLAALWPLVGAWAGGGAATVSPLGWGGLAAGVLAAAAFWTIAALWLLAASVFGALRLIANRPIGRSRPLP